MSHDINLALGFMDLYIPDTAEEEVPDAVEQLFQDAKFDAAMGKSGTAVTLRAETAGIHRRADQIFRRERMPAPAPGLSKAENDWDTEIIPDSHRLEKRDKMTSFYINWLGDQMEKTAKSSETIIAEWQQEFPDARPEILSCLEQAAAILDAA
jgi:hypothetical protein